MAGRAGAGFVYVAEQNGRHKIGFCRRTPESRVKALGAGALLLASVACDNPPRLEKSLHHRFAHRRLGGEWFRLEGADIEWVRSLGTESIRELLATPLPVAAKTVVPPEFTSRRATSGTRQLNVEVDDQLVGKFRSFLKARGERLRYHVEMAIRRHLDNPPPPLRMIDPPLPPVTPTQEAEEATKSMGRRKS